MKNVFFIGSFDPITNGHLDLIKRAYNIFGNISILLLENRNKKYLFDVDTRLKMIKDALRDEQLVCNVYKDSILLKDSVNKYNIDIIVRGIRDTNDTKYEIIQNRVNNDILDKKVEFVYLLADKNNSYISSSIVRELLSYDFDVSQYVPHSILKYLRKEDGEN